MAKLETWYKQDLKRPLVVHKHTDVFNQDSMGNLIGVEVYSDGEPVVLSGSISGYCLLADGTTVPAVGANRSGNKASVLIPQTAYSVPGPITITIKNVEEDNITTLCATVGVVRQSVSGNLVNPGSVVTDWSNNINVQLQAVQTAADNVGAIVAAPFDENTVYVAGNYVTNNGNLYRITADHAAGVAWSGTAKVQCTVGHELEALNNHFIANWNLIDPDEASGEKTGFIPVELNVRYNIIHAQSKGQFQYGLSLYGSNKTMLYISQLVDESTDGTNYSYSCTFSESAIAYVKIKINSAPSGIDTTDFSKVYFGKGSEYIDFADYNVINAIKKVKDDVSDLADEISDLNSALGTVPSGKTAQGQITDNASDISELKSAVNNVEDAVFTNEVVTVNNFTGSYNQVSLGNGYKYVAAIVPAGGVVTDLQVLVPANSTQYVKLEKWVYNSTTAEYEKPSETVEAISVTAQGNLYVLHFPKFTCESATLITFNDTSSSGWLKATTATWTLKRFLATETSVAESEFLNTSWQLAFSISYYTSENQIADIKASVLALNKKAIHKVIVSKDGKGDYTSVKTAIDTEPENTIIYVMPGVYTEETIDCRLKRVIVIGADRNQCIIQNPNGLYANPTFWAACGYFENLTILAPYISGTSEEVGVSDLGSYAMHIDTTNYNIDKQLELHHCTLQSDFFPAMGIGLRKGFTLIIDDCELINNQVVGRGDYSDEGTLGALYFHDAEGAPGDQNIKVHNSVMRSNLQYAMTPYKAYGQADVTVNCEFINNVLYSKTHGLTNNIWFRNDPFNSENGNFKLTIGFGNSNDSINN